MESLRLQSSITDNTEEETDSIDIKSGEINIILADGEKQIKHRVHMKVFRNTYEHHVQIYTDSEHNFTFGYISLRKCAVKVIDNSNVICVSGSKANGCGSIINDSVMLEAKNEKDTQEWLRSLTPSSQLCVSEFSPNPSPQTKRRE